MNKSQLYQTYKPWSINEVDQFFREKLHAVPIPFDHPDLYHDVYMPLKENTAGIYGIYDNAILHLLEGRVESIADMEFSLLSKKSPRYDVDDIDTVLAIGALVALETEDHQIVTGCFVGGETNHNRLNHLVNFFAGLPFISNQVCNDDRIKDFQTSLKVVKRMGFFM